MTVSHVGLIQIKPAVEVNEGPSHYFTFTMCSFRNRFFLSHLQNPYNTAVVVGVEFVLMLTHFAN